jgi:hypothetical protein
MTRLPVAHPLPLKPASIALCELAIAAGMTGHSVTLYFEEFPAPTLCQLLKYCIRYAGPAAVRNIHSQANVRSLTKDVDQVRLVLVHTTRLCNLVSWTIQTSGLVLEDGVPKPALFHCAGPYDAEGDPGATLVLRGDGAEQAAVAQWLLTAGNDHPDWETIPSVECFQREPALDAGLMALCLPTASAGGLRNHQVLNALLTGATLVRTMQEAPVPPHLITSIEDYQLVRRLLQTRLVVGADEVFDPLAFAMVSRANVYMAVKYDVGSDNPFYGDYSAMDRGERPGRELVTRREVSDLGNVRSRMVRQLITFLQHQPDGYERFRQMGLVRRSPDRDAWRRTGVNALIAYLRPWSAKQLRTHFERLRRQGMITAEREHGNGPWRYTLPEDLAARSNAYRNLPRIEGAAAASPVA